jgi:hypothetical protein
MSASIVKHQRASIFETSSDLMGSGRKSRHGGIGCNHEVHISPPPIPSPSRGEGKGGGGEAIFYVICR